VPLDHNQLISVIFPVKNEGENIRNTLDSIFSVETNVEFEVIVIDDHSDDGCCDFLSSYKHLSKIKIQRTEGLGAANARNKGAELSSGDILIFCDAHVFFEDYWIDRLISPILDGKADATNPGIVNYADRNGVGFGYSWNENLEPKWNIMKNASFYAQLLAGGCLAVRKSVFEDIGGFDTGFIVWGREDEEISFKLWTFGYRCMVIPKVSVIHIFRPAAPFRLRWDDINYNTMRMAYSHFSDERIEKCKALLKNSDPDEIERKVLSDGVMEQRKDYLSRRTFDDDWFMKKFGVDF